MFGSFFVYYFTLCTEGRWLIVFIIIEVTLRLEFADSAFFVSLGSRPRAVGKRTPRFPVSYLYDRDNGQKYISPTRQGLKLKVDSMDDDVAHEVALALAKASQRGGSPQVSQTPNRRRDNIRSSPVQNGERMVSTCPKNW